MMKMKATCILHSTVRALIKYMIREPQMESAREDNKTETWSADQHMTRGRESRRSRTRDRAHRKQSHGIIKTRTRRVLQHAKTSGIQNEFWKIRWRSSGKTKRRQTKKHQQHQPGNTAIWARPRIAAMMTKVIEDIEWFGPIGTKFSEARMGLLYKKKDKGGTKSQAHNAT